MNEPHTGFLERKLHCEEKFVLLQGLNQGPMPFQGSCSTLSANQEKSGVLNETESAIQSTGTAKMANYVEIYYVEEVL